MCANRALKIRNIKRRMVMKKGMIFILFAALICLGFHSVAFGFSSGSTGALGALNPSTNTVVQLPADGILNYTTVNIPTGVTVTFQKNAANTPVSLLATGDVTIAGTISVNGIDGNTMWPGTGGPGGFDGGIGGNVSLPGGMGFGPGAGNPGAVSTNTTSYPGGSGGGGAGFGTAGGNGSSNGTYAIGGTGGGTYGNVKIVPMLGGSSGGGGAGATGSLTHRGGAGGGGAGSILIASSGTITISGSITANGGKGGNSSGTYGGSGGGGSGGAIKLMANTISGEGTILVNGAVAGTGSSYPGGAGGNGMIRFEANTVTRAANTTPPYTYDYPGTVFVANVPTLAITSIGGLNVPAGPTGRYGSPDVTLPSTTTNPVTVNIAATSIPTGTTVTVTAAPEYGASTSGTGTLSGTNASSTTSVSVTLSITYQSILTASAVFTLQTAMYWEDEKIEKVRVAATMGGESQTVYITESGKEIKSAELMARLSGW
jgi:hypothetical protein